MTFNELKEFLDEKVILYNTPNFIDSDPIQIPHRFQRKEDIEIAGFLTATIAWGNRKMIINNANKLMSILGDSPLDFILSYKENRHYPNLDAFVHRTFNATDLHHFIRSLKHLYLNYNGLEGAFNLNPTLPLQHRISNFKQVFFEIPHAYRTKKHVSDPLKGSAAKRINMFLRWMVRNDKKGVDFGLWETIAPYELSCPLDVHSGNVARKLGLLTRKQNDAKALAELDNNLRLLDKHDPVKYDFALFGLGVFEKF